ncbi:MAG: hypothetical protein IMF09_08545 [Proteobacteria bacterium]|nr:hypothetical protein [Pseudomonadota bacterium]
MSCINQNFSINGLEYSAWISLNGEFSFGLMGGASRKGAVYSPKKNCYDFWPDCHVYDDVDLNPNALPVYVKAGKILTNWIYRAKPHRFGFSASTGRKINIYRWFAKKLSARFPEYMCSEYPEGNWSFYRVV